MMLSSVSLACYHHILSYAIAEFVRFVKCVWNVETVGKTDRQIAAYSVLLKYIKLGYNYNTYIV